MTGSDGEENWEMLFKDYKLSAIRWRDFGEIIFSMVTRVDINTVLYTPNLVWK